MLTNFMSRILIYDHTFAFPRMIWYFALLCLAFIGYPFRYIGISLVLIYVMYVLSALLYNFFVNRKGVFKSQSGIGRAIVRYYILAACQMTLSALGVSWLFEALGGNETLIKVVVDTVLFLISFQIQREWVFKKKD